MKFYDNNLYIAGVYPIVDGSPYYRSNYKHVTGVEYFHLLPKHVTRGWQIIGKKKWRDVDYRVTS